MLFFMLHFITGSMSPQKSKVISIGYYVSYCFGLKNMPGQKTKFWSKEYAWTTKEKVKTSGEKHESLKKGSFTSQKC